MSKSEAQIKKDEPIVINKVFTIPNVISLIRLCLVPAFLILLVEGHRADNGFYNLIATLLFAIAAGTDWIDGQIARKTNTVSKVGQLLDPAVDRILMISGVLGLLYVGRLPLWIIVLVIARDGILLAVGAYLLQRYKIRIPVIFTGKVATTLLFVGFAGLLLNWPQFFGLGLVEVSWLPGFNGELFSCWIWFVYVGLFLALIVAFYYGYVGFKELKKARASRR